MILSVIDPNRRPPRRPLAGKWIHKLYHIPYKWNTTRQWKVMNYRYMQQHGWISKHYIKRKKLGHITYGFIYMSSWKRKNHNIRNQISGCLPRTGSCKKGLITRELSGMIKYSISWLVIWLYTFVLIKLCP